MDIPYVFKLRTNSKLKYHVKPYIGVIPPKQCQKVIIAIKCSDAFDQTDYADQQIQILCIQGEVFFSFRTSNYLMTNLKRCFKIRFI